MYRVSAMNGGVTVFVHNGMDAAVAMVNPRSNTLLVLNIHPAHRSHGLGSAVVRYIAANFARVIESAVPFFARNGYQSIGEMHHGKRFRTQVMVKATLPPLAGRVSRLLCEVVQ